MTDPRPFPPPPVEAQRTLGSGALVRLRQVGNQLRVETLNGELVAHASGSISNAAMRAGLSERVAADHCAGPTRREDLARIFTRLELPMGGPAA
jgi:hypothetical protein